MPRRFGSCGGWIRNTSAHESSRPGNVGTRIELWSHSIVVVHAVSVGSNAAGSPGITPMRNCTYFSTGISGKSTGPLKFGCLSCVAAERLNQGRSVEIVFAATSTQSFGTIKYIVWRHEVGTRKAAADKKSPQRTWGILWWERAREGGTVSQAAEWAEFSEIGP